MSANFLDNKSASNVVVSDSLQSISGNQVRKRKRWSMEMNIFIVREYLHLTKLEKEVGSYRSELFNAFRCKYPQFPVTIQNVADQRRAIMKKNYIPSVILDKIKDDIKKEMSNNLFDSSNGEENLDQNSNENTPHDGLLSCQSSVCALDNSTQYITTIQTTQSSQHDTQIHDLNHNSIHVTNQNFYYHTNFKEEIEEEFKRALNKFNTIDPFDRPNLPKQKFSKKFFATIEIINTFILPKYLSTNTSFKELHDIIYSAAVAIIRLNDSKEFYKQNKIPTKLPQWEVRLTTRIDKIRQNLGRITQYLRGVDTNHIKRCIDLILKNNRVHCSTYNEYNHTLAEVKDTLTQKLQIYAKRLKRYKANKQRKFENRRFLNNEKIFYRNLTNKQNVNNNNGIPDISSLEKFWSNIWSTNIEHNKTAEWIHEVSNDTSQINESINYKITHSNLIENIKNSHNWKSPGGDKIHNFWIKKFTCTHKYLLNHFNKFIEEPNTFPKFLARGITYLKPKDSDTRNPSKYRPITCLPAIYKILTSCIKQIIYNHCEKLNIINQEQKGCIQQSFGCKEQLIIDSVIMEQARKNNRNIYTAFIDYKKAYDSVPHSWLIKILEIYKIDATLIKFLSYIMQFWNTTLNLSIENTNLKSNSIPIKRGIYQGDSLSPLWFCLAINPLSRLLNSTGYGFNIRNNNTTLSKLSHLLYMDDIKLYASKKDHILSLLTVTENFSNDIKMSFGIDKCKMRSICRGHYETIEYTTQNDEIIKSLNKDDFYKYLGINQSNHIQHTIIKEKIEKQFCIRLKLLLNSKLNGKNLIKAVNTYAVPLLTYSFGIIKWTKTDIQNLNIKTRVLFTKFNKHHSKSAIERFNLPREFGGRGFTDLTILHNNQIGTLKTYFCNKAQNNSLIKAIVLADKGYTPLNLSKDETIEIKQPDIINIITEIKQKALHGNYFKDLEQPDIDVKESHTWLKKSNIHPETEGFIFGIQDRVINTRNYKKHICKDQSVIDKCRICGSSGETIEHIISSCTVLAQSDYKTRHDNFAKIIHIELALKFRLIENSQPYYLYTPESCLENDGYKLYFDRTVLTDIHIKHNRPDIIIFDKQEKQGYLIDIAVPNSHNLLETYNTKINKYLGLSVAIKNLWQLEKITIIPLIISATGVVPKSLIKNLKILDLKTNLIADIQKAVLLYTCHIVRKFLNIHTDQPTLSKSNRHALARLR